MDKFRIAFPSKRRSSHSVFWCLWLFLTSFCFLSVYSYYSSPFFAGDNGYDAGFFRLVGQGMTRGYLPYRDFFDMKGPYFFLIEYIGQLISYGRVGIFLVQTFNLSLALFLICKIYQLHGIQKHWQQFLLLIPILYVASFTFQGGNLTEEFSLVPLLLCLLLSFQYFHSHQMACKPYNGFLCGLCFGFLVLIRATNALLICAIMLVVSIDLLLRKLNRSLLHNAIGFVAGIAIICIPILIFYGFHGLLDEMFESVFILGFKYSGEQTIFEHFQELFQGEQTQRLLLLIIPFLVGLVAKFPTWKERALLLAGCVFTFVGIAAGNNYTHYYAMTIPTIVMAIGSATRPQRGTHDDVLLQKLATSLLLIAMLFPQYKLVKEYTDRAKELTQYKGSFKNYEAIPDYIPPEEHDSVFSYNIDPSWYTYTDLFPCIKYCGWQNHYITLMPEIALEMQQIFQTTPPKWLVLPAKETELPAFLEAEIANNYRVSEKTFGWILLQHK